MKKVLTVLAMVVAVVSMVVLSACGNSITYDVVKQTKADNFTLLNDSAEHGQIVMCGDSIVELYPQELLYNFPSKENPLIVYNRGISGDSTIGLKGRFEKNVLKIKPSVVSFLIGTNNFQMGISLEVTLSNLNDMILAAKAAGVKKIVLQSIYPVQKSINPSMVGGRTNHVIETWNSAYKELCEKTGAVFAEVYSALRDDNGNFKTEYTYDGLHPNAAGYVVLTQLLAPYFTLSE